MEILKQLKSALEKASKAESSVPAAQSAATAVQNGIDESLTAALTGLSAETLKNMATEQVSTVLQSNFGIFEIAQIRKKQFLLNQCSNFFALMKSP